MQTNSAANGESVNAESTSSIRVAPRHPAPSAFMESYLSDCLPTSPLDARIDQKADFTLSRLQHCALPRKCRIA